MNVMKEVICYCFDYSREDIIRDLLENGRSLIMEKIESEKRLGSCRCALKNPKGR